MCTLLQQITTCTSHHSSDNTQYYANRCLCDSCAAFGDAYMAQLTADQLAYISYASLSAASLFPNIWLLHSTLPCLIYFTVCKVSSFPPPRRTSHFLCCSIHHPLHIVFHIFFSFSFASLLLVCSAVSLLTHKCCLLWHMAPQLGPTELLERCSATAINETTP